jgi:hypothetical protein
MYRSYAHVENGWGLSEALVRRPAGTTVTVSLAPMSGDQPPGVVLVVADDELAIVTAMTRAHRGNGGPDERPRQDKLYCEAAGRSIPSRGRRGPLADREETERHIANTAPMISAVAVPTEARISSRWLGRRPHTLSAARIGCRCRACGGSALS